jgi:TRAP-type C4-dicarboxylate transport system permease small subunit
MNIWFKKTANLIDRVTHPIVSVLKSIAMGILVIMMFLTAMDVFFRYIFNRPITGSYELIEFMMATLVAFGIAYCAVIDGHVSVDLVVARFSEKTQAIIGSITSLLSLCLFILITWQNILYIRENFHSKLTSAVLFIPVYPFIVAMAIGFAVLCMVLLTNLFRYLSEATTK